MIQNASDGWQEGQILARSAPKSFFVSFVSSWFNVLPYPRAAA
jgi:hypothetical protein